MATEASTNQNLTGCVKWFNNGLNYGFITVLTEGEYRNTDIFVHQSNIRTSRDCFRTLYTGECVQFELTKSDNEKHPVHAVNVLGFNGALLRCEAPRGVRQYGSGMSSGSGSSRGRGRGSHQNGNNRQRAQYQQQSSSAPTGTSGQDATTTATSTPETATATAETTATETPQTVNVSTTENIARDDNLAPVAKGRGRGRGRKVSA